MVNLAYAATFGHTLIVAGALHGSHPAPPPMDPRFGKVQLLHRVLSSGHFDVVMWLDADAALVEFARDVVGELAAAHLVGPGENNKELLVCREPVDVSEPSVVNSGSLMLRHSPWALRFLRQWWEHPDAQRGAADQRVFDRCGLPISSQTQPSVATQFVTQRNKSQKDVCLLGLLEFTAV